MQETELKTTDHFHNPAAATNMTMIAKINGENGANDANDVLKVYIGDELVGVAEPYSIPSLSEASPLYFLTIQSDHSGTLRFETEDGEPLTMYDAQCTMNYVADSHYGSLEEPVILLPEDPSRVYKVIEDNHVVIIRNNEKYDVTGKKL